MKLSVLVLLASAVSGSAVAQPNVEVFLNHAFVVPDQATYNAIANSSFMRDEFGAFESRTTVRKDMTYTGLYWYGTNTYFEILQPSSRPGPPSGIAFGIEKTNGLKDIVQSGVKGQIHPVTRQAEGKDVNWFHMLEIGRRPDFPIELFAIEYEPDFLDKWYPQFPPSTASIRRKDVLTRYAAKVDRLRQRETGLLGDIVAIHLVLGVDHEKEFLQTCRKLGFEVVELKPAICKSLDITFTVAATGSGRPGIASVEFRLNHPKPGQQTIYLGTSTLDFRDHTAVWNF
jgi:hypothetical protein